MPEVIYQVDLPAFTGTKCTNKGNCKSNWEGCTVCKGWTSTRNSQIWDSNKDC